MPAAFGRHVSPRPRRTRAASASTERPLRSLRMAGGDRPRRQRASPVAWEEEPEETAAAAPSGRPRRQRDSVVAAAAASEDEDDEEEEPEETATAAARSDDSARGRAVVSAEAQRALELWVNQLRAELRETKAQLHAARQAADELVDERESQRAEWERREQQAAHTERLEAELAATATECLGLREELAEMTRQCKQHELDARDLRAEVRGEQAKAELLRDAQTGRGAMRSVLQERLDAAKLEIVELEQENRAQNAELRLLRSQRDSDGSRRAQERRTRRELRLAIKEIVAVIESVTAQLRNSGNRHAALPLGAPNPEALERVVSRLYVALGTDTSSADASAHADTAVLEHHGDDDASSIGSVEGESRRRRLSIGPLTARRPRTTAR